MRQEIKEINDTVFNHCNMLDEIELKIIQINYKRAQLIERKSVP
jgi:hypothetical protein